VKASRVVLRALGGALAVLSLAGCGALTELAGGVVGGVAGGVGGVASAARTVIAPPPATLAPITVEVVAPAPLQALLLQHLDVVRLAELARGESVSDSELTRLLDAAPAQVTALSRTEGYFSPTLRIQRLPPAAEGLPQRVRLEVDPGPRAVISQLRLEVEGPLAREVAAGDARAMQVLQSLRAGFGLKPGMPFRNETWVDAKGAALARLRSAGHAAAQWSTSAADVDVERAGVSLTLVADAGPLFRSGPFEVEGTRLHDPRTVTSLAGFSPGAVLTEALLLDFQERLQKSGLFDRASVSFEPDPARADAAPVRVRVDEAARHQLVLGLGISANTGPRATVEHIDRRLFGLPARSRNKAEWGRSRQAWDGELSTHADADLYRWIAGGTLERLESDVDVVLTQRLRAGRAQDGLRIDRLFFVEADRSSTRTSAGPLESLAYTGNFHWSWRDLDSPVLPTQGLTASVQLALGHARDGDSGLNGSFGRAWGRLELYRPLGAGWYGQARVEAGSVFAPEGLAVPDGLRFRAGGDDSVRGYAYRSLGPTTASGVGSGDALLTASVELARPLSASLPQWWGAVFVDAGNAADSLGSLRPVVGSGVGVRWRSPVGPLRLDLAYGEAVRRTRIHFSVGIAF
jgi:translocation and assembly module TamA